VRSFFSKFKLIALEEGLGGMVSIIGYQTMMSHGSLSPTVRKEAGISDTLIRLSVGIEDVTVLISDLQLAMKQIEL